MKKIVKEAVKTNYIGDAPAFIQEIVDEFGFEYATYEPVRFEQADSFSTGNVESLLTGKYQIVTSHVFEVNFHYFVDNPDYEDSPDKVKGVLNQKTMYVKGKSVTQQEIDVTLERQDRQFKANIKF